MGIKIGTGPDSWGISSPNNPLQINWKQYIKEISEAGYEYTELGPFGYFSTDPTILKTELKKIQLKTFCCNSDGLPLRHKNRLGKYS